MKLSELKLGDRAKIYNVEFDYSFTGKVTLDNDGLLRLSNSANNSGYLIDDKCNYLWQVEVLYASNN